MDSKRYFLGVSGSIILVLGLFLLVFNINLQHPVVQTNSCSNYPKQSPGNIVLIEDTGFSEIEKSDTVIYRVSSEKLTVVHQVINISDNSLQTKGMNNGQQLPFENDVKPSQVWGTPAFVLPLSDGTACSSRK